VRDLSAAVGSRERHDETALAGSPPANRRDEGRLAEDLVEPGLADQPHLAYAPLIAAELPDL
jgi:hypothetical protein